MKAGNCIFCTFTCGLIIVNVDPLQLEIRVSMIGAGGVDSVLVRNHLPELENKETGMKFIDNINYKAIRLVCINSNYLDNRFNFSITRGHESVNQSLHEPRTHV